MTMPAHLSDDLDDLAQVLADAASAHGLRVWPAPLGDGRGWPLSTLWPSLEDPDGFVEAAVDLGADVLYLDQLRAGDLPESDDVDVGASADVVQVTAAFVHSGVVHHLTAVSSTWMAEREVQDFRAQLDVADDEARIDQLAREVVDNPAFQDHGGPDRHDRQLAAVREMHPQLDDWTAWKVARAADRIDATERKPGREAKIAAEAHQMVAEGSTKVAAATHFGITVNVLNRIMQQNPPAS